MATMKRNPAQEDPSAELADEQPSAEESNDAANTPDALAADAKPNAPAVSGISQQDRSTMTRGIAGAAPALMSFLFGASPLTAEQNIQDAQKQYQEGAAKKLAMTVGPDGKPQYSDIRNAPGLEPYIKPMRPTAGGLGKNIVIEDPSNPSQPKNAIYDPIQRAVVDMDTQKIIPNARPYTPPSIQRGVGPGGEQIAIPLSPRTGAVVGSTTLIAQGEAASRGQGTKEMEQGYKVATDVAKERLPIQAKRADINTSIGLLNSGSSTTQLIGVANTLKNLSQQGLADKNAMPFAPPGVFQRAQDAAETLIAGNVTTEKLNAAKTVLSEIGQSLDEQDRALTQNYTNAASGTISPAVPTPKMVTPPPQDKPITETQFFTLPPEQRARLIEQAKQKQADQLQKAMQAQKDMLQKIRQNKAKGN